MVVAFEAGSFGEGCDAGLVVRFVGGVDSGDDLRVPVVVAFAEDAAERFAAAFFAVAGDAAVAEVFRIGATDEVRGEVSVRDAVAGDEARLGIEAISGG